MTQSHQYKLRQQTIEEDLTKIDFDPNELSPKDFKLSLEDFSFEIETFIKRYVWLGTAIS